jgi:hypothetical protein
MPLNFYKYIADGLIVSELLGSIPISSILSLIINFENGGITPYFAI